MYFTTALQGLTGRFASKDYGGNDDGIRVGGNGIIGGHGLGVMGGNDTGDEVAQTDGARRFWSLKFTKGAAGLVAVSGLALFGGGTVVISRGDGGGGGGAAAAVSASTSSQQRRHVLLEAGGSPESAVNLGRVAALSVDDAPQHSARRGLQEAIEGSTESTDVDVNAMAMVDDDSTRVARRLEGVTIEAFEALTERLELVEHVLRNSDIAFGVDATSTYFFRIDELMNAEDARERCAYEGFDLAKIVTKEENAMAASVCNGADNDRSCWIGVDTAFKWAENDATMDPDYTWTSMHHNTGLAVNKVCGSNYLCSKEPYLAADAEMGKVRCCSDNDPGSETGWWFKQDQYGCDVWASSHPTKTCLIDMTYADANSFCDSVGARLCTVDEIENNCAASGCNYNADYIWAARTEHCTLIHGDITSAAQMFDWSHASCNAMSYPLCSTQETYPDWDEELKTDGTKYVIESQAHQTYILGPISVPVKMSDNALSHEQFTFENGGIDTYFIRSVSFGTYVSCNYDQTDVEMMEGKTSMYTRHIIKLNGSSKSPSGRRSYSISCVNAFGNEVWYMHAKSDGTVGQNKGVNGSSQRFYIKALE